MLHPDKSQGSLNLPDIQVNTTGVANSVQLLHYSDRVQVVGNLAVVISEPAWGKWEGDALTFESKSPMGWGRYTFNFKADGTHQFRIDNSQDGKDWKPFMEGKYRKA